LQPGIKELDRVGMQNASGESVTLSSQSLHPLNYGRKVLGLAMNPTIRKRTLNAKQTGKEAAGLEDRLRRLVAGQDEAVHQVVNMFQMFTTGLTSPGKPIGSFLFLGPTGTGKTRLVEAAAECMVKRPNPVIKIDCAEFQHSHEIAKLVGSPPGYLGHRETHAVLSQEALDQHHSDECKLTFLLFDEIEKASDSLWNLLLGILDKGVLTLGDNRKVDFSRVMIFMTSNLGAAEMHQIGNPRMGFARAAGATVPVGDAKLEQKRDRTGVETARRKFTPEFMNRLDKVIVFKSLSEKDLRRVLDIELAIFQQRLLANSNQKKFVFSVCDEGKQFLLENGMDPRYGARYLKRSMEKLLVQPISNLLATQQIEDGDVIRVEFDANARELTFQKECEGLPIGTMFEMIDTSVPVQLSLLAASVKNEQPKPASTGAAQKQKSRS
jgi:ATP-dependent Clp protease ATP-binding subunit ClpB